MRVIFSSILVLSITWLCGQSHTYEYVSYNKGLQLPELLNSERSAVIFAIPPTASEFNLVGEYESMLNKVHKGFITMSIDAVFYLNDLNLTASAAARDSYVEIFKQREIENVIFLTRKSAGFELLVAPFSGDSQFIEDGSDVFFQQHSDLDVLLLTLGKEVRRAELAQANFLIPEKPNLLDGVSIVEETLLKNYPGILRRSKLAVERFAYLDTTKVTDATVLARIKQRNQEIKRQNKELEKIFEASYPYEWEMIDRMSDDDLKRRRLQFVLRSVSGAAKSVRQMLDYEVRTSEASFVSVIPVMPDQKKSKTIPKEAIVYKFFIRQNISKNIHVGEWDADTSWQKALRNMIGNLSQKLNVKK